MVITANDVKKRGVSIFKELLEKFDDIVINVRGKNRYVVVDYDSYKEFREYQLDKAYKEVMQDYKNGDYKTLTPQEHIASLKKELNV